MSGTFGDKSVRAMYAQPGATLAAVHGWHATGDPSVPPDSAMPSRLELLAYDAGMNPWRLREWLREKIDRPA